MLLLYILPCTIYFEENFDDDDWEQRWVYSTHKPVKGSGHIGAFRVSPGSFYGNQQAARGLQTIDPGSWYQISSKFNQPFNTSNKTLVLQYTQRFENGYNCSGGYIKLLGPDLKQARFNSESPYYIMWGPDVCKPNKRNVDFLITRNNTHFDLRKQIDCFTDELTHSYTLIIFPNRSYELRFDGETAQSGELDVDFEIGGTEMIADPDDIMPDDWDDREYIPDPTASKPHNWDDREIIPDSDAVEPPEWREHIQGKWQPPFIPNPNYRGPWKPPMIQNPAFKGHWTPNLIRNPSFYRDSSFGVFEDISYLGIEVFQVTPGSIFDNILVTDDLSYAERRLRENFLQYKEEEYTNYNRMIQDKRAEEQLRKIQESQDDDLTDKDLYSTSSKSGFSSVTTSSERSDHFNFPSNEVTDPPTAELFQFPLNIANNPYFLEKMKMNIRKSSVGGRRQWANYRREKATENEQTEDFMESVNEEEL